MNSNIIKKMPEINPYKEPSKKDLQWFKDRVGKKIHRTTPTSCKCEVCSNVFKKGLIISDDTHAHYLFDCQNEMGLIYDDNKN